MTEAYLLKTVFDSYDTEKGDKIYPFPMPPKSLGTKF